MRTRLLAVLGVAVAASACRTEIVHELAEPEANEILVLLSESGIHASKEPEEGGREITWKVIVHPQDAAQATRILQENELPRPKTTGFEIFDQGGLIPTATEERAKLLQSISGELSRTLRSIDGVLLARVHINIPETNDLADVKEKPLPTASVLIKYRNLAGPDRPPTPPPVGKREVQELVARAVQDLKPEAVAVVEVPGVLPGATTSGETDFVDILGLRMSRDSASTFKMAAAAGVLFILLLVAYIIWLNSRGLRDVSPRRTRTTD